MLRNWQFPNKQISSGQRVECSRWQKMSTKYKKHQIIFGKKKRLLEITLSQHKGCQLHLTENALQDILPPETSK